MPPKRADEGALRSQAVAQFTKFFADTRPPLSKAEYERLIPKYNGVPHWTAQEDSQLKAEGRYACIMDPQGQQPWDKNGGARLLWRLFPLVYRCLPTDLFSWGNQIDVDTSKNFSVREGRYQGEQNVVWSSAFCQALVLFTMHSFWTYENEWDIPIMTQFMQLAVICRTNDCRRWRVVNHTEDTFFDELANEVQTGWGRTIKDIVDTVDARMNTLNRRPSEFRLLCREIVSQRFNASARPLLNGVPGPYKVTTEDVQALVEILNRFGPSPERTGITNGFSAKEWKTIVDKSSGSGNSHYPLEPTTPTFLARAMIYGFTARVRDEKIAERIAQSVAAVAPPEEDVEMSSEVGLHDDFQGSPVHPDDSGGSGDHDDDDARHFGADPDSYRISSWISRVGDEVLGNGRDHFMNSAPADRAEGEETSQNDEIHRSQDTEFAQRRLERFRKYYPYDPNPHSHHAPAAASSPPSPTGGSPQPGPSGQRIEGAAEAPPREQTREESNPPAMPPQGAPMRPGNTDPRGRWDELDERAQTAALAMPMPVRPPRRRNTRTHSDENSSWL